MGSPPNKIFSFLRCSAKNRTQSFAQHMHDIQPFDKRCDAIKRNQRLPLRVCALGVPNDYHYYLSQRQNGQRYDTHGRTITARTFFWLYDRSFISFRILQQPFFHPYRALLTTNQRRQPPKKRKCAYGTRPIVFVYFYCFRRKWKWRQCIA